MTLNLEQRFDLTKYNSFSVPCTAEYFCSVSSVEEILEARAFAHEQGLPISILGGGSNVVLRSNLPGLCVHVKVDGLQTDRCIVKAGAGENWHQLVLNTVQQELSGLENLALIPGLVGAAPIQNIGAYGAELSEFVVSVQGIELVSGEGFEFSRADCEFGYRDSLFKHSSREQYLITHVTLSLNTTFTPRLGYQGLEEALEQLNSELSAAAVAEAVTRLRRSKLPDPAEYGNAGSFFKNPTVHKEALDKLLELDPTLQGRVQGEHYKLSAGQIIDLCGLKGLRSGGARVSEKHALVIENAGNATGGDVLALATRIQHEVKTRFDLELEIEPRILPV